MLLIKLNMGIEMYKYSLFLSVSYLGKGFLMFYIFNNIK